MVWMWVARCQEEADLMLGQALQGYPGIQTETNVHVTDLAFADKIAILSNSYREVQCLLETVNHHVVAVGMCID